jgi:hypothetical protein
MKTIDLSVDGAKLLLEKKHHLPPGASVRIEFRGESSPARVLESVKIDADTRLLRLTLEHPPQSFMRVIDYWLKLDAGGRKFVEGTWLGESA